MEEYNNNQSKPKQRRRSNPVHKWNLVEEKALVEFLLENRNFEKPTSQIYYNRFIEEKELAVEWKLVRAKVRNMRTSYNKAKVWEGSTGAGSMEGGTIKSTLRKIFFYFEEFDEIFGGRLDSAAVVEDSIMTLIKSASYTDSPSPVEVESVSDEGSAVEVELQNANKSMPTCSRKGIYSKTALSEILEVHGEIAKIRKKKIEMEAAAREREICLKERELELKAKEMELKEKEISDRNEIEKLKLQMQERLAMEELKFNYK